MSTFEVPYALLNSILELVVICLFVASFIFVIWAFLRKRGPSRRRLFVASLASFLFLVTAFTSAVTLTYFVQLPAIRRNSVDFYPPYSYWNEIFAAVGSALMFASVSLLICAIVRNRGARTRTLSSSICCFLLFVTASAANYSLIHSIQLPAITRHQINTRGTLVIVGDTVPDVSFTSLDETQVCLSALRGKVVLLNYFATWCSPCIKELPHLQDLWNELGGNDDFHMLVVSRGEDRETVTVFKTENGFTFPMALDPDASAFHKFADQGIPRSYLLSDDGTILFQSTGFAETDFYRSELIRLRKIIDGELYLQNCE